ncbi:hypothetical protein ColTof3_06986 [Colletotrichum tofieldiae]|nr:hypothetical protein ColTof3_06986 [Colletotrichum tofieldiae]
MGIATGTTGTYGLPLASLVEVDQDTPDDTVKEKLVRDETDVCVDSLLLQVLLALVSEVSELERGVVEVPDEALVDEKPELHDEDSDVRTADEMVLELKLKLDVDGRLELLKWELNEEEPRELLVVSVLAREEVELLVEVLVEDRLVDFRVLVDLDEEVVFA